MDTASPLVTANIRPWRIFNLTHTTFEARGTSTLRTPRDQGTRLPPSCPWTGIFFRSGKDSGIHQDEAGGLEDEQQFGEA